MATDETNRFDNFVTMFRDNPPLWWNLDGSFAHFLAAGMTVLLENGNGFPGSYDSEAAWNAELTVHIATLREYGDDGFYFLPDTEKQDRLEAALLFLATNFQSLWD